MVAERGGARSLSARLVRFGIVGVAVVGIDAGVYAAVTAITDSTIAGKMAGFVVAATFAYVANWRFTFGAVAGRASPLIFAAVYLASLALNTTVNEWLLSLDASPWSTHWGAFMVATAAAATWNFVGMSLFVFRTPTAAP